MDKTTLLYTPGSNGEFTFRFLNQFKINPNTSYTAWDEPPKFTEKYRGDHHLIREEDVDGHVTKITYNDENIDLINRNKWTKVKGHLEEQSKKTYPNNKNKEIYTMAIYKCLLLDKNNHFKKIYKENNIEIKFSWFFQSFNDWMKNFSNVFEKLNIPIKEEIILEYYNAFNLGQKEILDKHNRSNDLIFLSNKLGQRYFEKHQTNFSEQKFDEIYNNIGAQYV